MLNKTINLVFSIIPISFILGNSALNLNILLINSLFVFFVIKNNKWEWCKSFTFKILISLYFFLVLNSYFNYILNPTFGFDGLFRSIGFLKFIILIFSFQYLIYEKKQMEKIFKNWMLIIIIVIIDVFYERIFGQNILGFKSQDYTRIISFFYDENVVGAFLLTFSFTVCLYYISKNLIWKKKFLINILFFLIPLSILISGERSNFLKCLILFSLILFFIQSNKLILNKFKISFLIIFSIILSVLVSPNIFIKQTEFFKRIIIEDKSGKFFNKFQNIHYIAHYKTAWEIFKDHPINGVGSKNFRIKCADEKYFDKDFRLSSRRCSTHPHQLHFELLSEQGIIGYFLFFYFALNFIYQNLKISIKSKNIFHIGINFYLLIFLIPILPGGGIFSTFNGSLFWIILALANLNKNSKITL